MEFEQVMNDFRRFCAAQQKIAEQKNALYECSGCELENNTLCCDTASAFTGEAIRAVESVVTKWAKENPEPVYPTWGEYLISKGLLMPYWNEQGTAPYDMYIYAERALANHIPADIAQKLGLQPKENA